MDVKVPMFEWHQIKIENKPHLWYQTFDWLDNNIGPENICWYYAYPSKLFFKNEEDKVKFILQWM